MNKVSIKMVLENVRGSYVFVTEQRKKDDGSPGGYGVQILMDKNHPQIKKMKKVIDKVLKEAFGEKALRQRGKYKLPLRDPDVAEDHDDYREGEEFEGCYFFNANSKFRKPGIVNRQGDIADEDDIEDYCYSGAYFHFSINFYAFPAKDGGKPGVAVGLNNVMLRKKADRLDGSTTASKDFEDYGSDEDDDDFDDDDL